ncbi:hypothetical protein AMELA_G00055600 [Ameiurus melas]|uniref:Uncharacterized protein n=1 Tax=Ameiurus melas TaxID=219545 RepID=A0A7J6B6K9_AMEME|nr:hypothetical protein AMELA_G00055600 [Ameiurus melas]
MREKLIAPFLLPPGAFCMEEKPLSARHQLPFYATSHMTPTLLPKGQQMLSRTSLLKETEGLDHVLQQAWNNILDNLFRNHHHSVPKRVCEVLCKGELRFGLFALLVVLWS